MVSRVGDQMEVWSGGQKKDVVRSNGRFRSQVMRVLGAVWDWCPAGCLGVPKTRLLACAHRDARAEG